MLAKAQFQVMAQQVANIVAKSADKRTRLSPAVGHLKADMDPGSSSSTCHHNHSRQSRSTTHLTPALHQTLRLDRITRTPTMSRFHLQSSLFRKHNLPRTGMGSRRAALRSTRRCCTSIKKITSLSQDLPTVHFQIQTTTTTTTIALCPQMAMFTLAYSRVGQSVDLILYITISLLKISVIFGYLHKMVNFRNRQVHTMNFKVLNSFSRLVRSMTQLIINASTQVSFKLLPVLSAVLLSLPLCHRLAQNASTAVARSIFVQQSFVVEQTAKKKQDVFGSLQLQRQRGKG